jgi:hypothetical protein
MVSIGIICEYPFEIFLQKNLLKYLPDSELILSDTIYLSEINGGEKIKTMNQIVTERNLSARIFNRNDDPEKFFKPYNILLSARYQGAIMLGVNKNKFKVRVFDGYGKDLGHYAFYNCYFNLILTQGIEENEIFKLFTTSELIGTLQHDDWHNKNFDKIISNYIVSKLDPKKKTVLYMPTHHGFSSFPRSASKINQLARDFNVIVKPHHKTLWMEKDVVKKVYSEFHPSIITLNERYCDIITLMSQADVFISDNSGSLFYALLTGKPIVFAEWAGWGEDELKKYKFEDLSRSYTNSSEQRLKYHNPPLGPSISESGDLKEAIEMALARKDRYLKIREELLPVYFSNLDGICAKRAADVIMSQFKKGPEEPTLLARLIDKETQDIIARSRQGFLIYLKTQPFFEKIKFLFKIF